MNCKKCNSVLPEGANFCNICGKKQISEEVFIKDSICHECLHEVADDSKFCNNCGSKVNVVKEKRLFVVKRYVAASLSFILAILLTISIFIPVGSLDIGDLVTNPQVGNTLRISSSNYNYIDLVKGMKYLSKEWDYDELTAEFGGIALDIIADFDININEITPSQQRELMTELVKRINPLILFSVSEVRESSVLPITLMIIMLVFQSLLLLLVPVLIIYGILLIIRPSDDKYSKTNNIVQNVTIISLLGVIVLAKLFHSTFFSFTLNSDFIIFFASLVLIKLIVTLVFKAIQKELKFNPIIKGLSLIAVSSVALMLLVNTGVNYKYTYLKAYSSTDEVISIVKKESSVKSLSLLMVLNIEDNGISDIGMYDYTKDLLTGFTYQSKQENINEIKLTHNGQIFFTEGFQSYDVIINVLIMATSTLILLSTVGLIGYIVYKLLSNEKINRLIPSILLGTILALTITQIVGHNIGASYLNNLLAMEELNNVREVGLILSVSAWQYVGLGLLVTGLAFTLLFKDNDKVNNIENDNKELIIEA